MANNNQQEQQLVLNKTSLSITSMTSLFMGATFTVFIFLFPLVGILVACIGFCDPDTCWHLALGKWIFTHHSLPYTDPFSSNIFHSVFVAENLPLMQHEWLSDLVLFCIFRPLGLVGLLVFTAIASICSFVILPAMLMLRNRVPRIIAISLITSGLWSSSFRLWVRPELFSFLFMSGLILVNEICQATKKQKILLLCYSVIFLIMSLWANFHALFFVGLAYLAGYYSLGLLEFALRKKTPINLKRSIIGFLVALAGTINTPWHFKFWQYIYKLTASPVTYSNRENGAMRLSDFVNPTFLPLCLLLALVWGILLWLLYKRKEASQTKLLPMGLSLAATIVIIGYHRLTPLALLVLFAALSKAFQINKNESVANRFLQTSENYFEQYHMPYEKTRLATGLLVCALVCFVTSTCFVQPSVPAPSRLFHPPYAAIQYLEHHPLRGRLLNDSKFGSMMTWDMSNPPDIFVDGRFDSFDRKLVYDYNKMRLCKDDWRTLLDKYKIDWLFFPPEAPIVSELSKAPAWKVEYSDDKAAILSRLPTDVNRKNRI